jgi:hypothetical protein
MLTRPRFGKYWALMNALPLVGIRLALGLEGHFLRRVQELTVAACPSSLRSVTLLLRKGETDSI